MVDSQNPQAESPSSLPLPTVTCCMIVRDEADRIRQCLDSIPWFVKELVVVDTGSLDDTKGIIEYWANEHRMALTIVDFEWCDNFSAARNQALRHATGDFVLSIDADERWHPDSDQPAIQYITSGTDNILASRICQENGHEHMSNARLFRREGAEWLWYIHEDIWYPEKQDVATIHDPRVAVLHYGDHDLPTKAERNLMIAAKQLEAFPQHYKAHLDYGAELLRRNAKDPLALGHLLQAFQNLPKDSALGKKTTVLLLQAMNWQMAATLEQAAAKGFQGLWWYPYYSSVLFSNRQYKQAFALSLEAGVQPFDAFGDERQIRAHLGEIEKASALMIGYQKATG